MKTDTCRACGYLRVICPQYGTEYCAACDPRSLDDIHYEEGQ